MPQMMPINWIMSFFIFICIFIMFNIMNYYIYSPNSIINKNKMNFYKNNITWKW